MALGCAFGRMEMAQGYGAGLGRERKSRCRLVRDVEAGFRERTGPRTGKREAMLYTSNEA